MKTFKMLALFALLGLVACTNNDKAAQLEALKQKQAELSREIKALEDELKNEGLMPETGKKVVIDTLSAGPFSTFVEVQGRVDARENVEVSAENMGMVKQILVREGDKVNKGDVLAELDNSMLTKSMDELKTQLEFARSMFEKQEYLWSKQIGTEVQYLQAKNQKEGLEKRMATLQSQLDMTRIKAPVSGTVDEVNIKLGQAVSPGLPAFRVVNLSNMRVVADLAESYIAKINAGDEVKLYFKDYQREESSTVTHVAKSINQMNRTFRVEAALDTRVASYNPNMIVVLRIKDYQVDSTISIPVNLIQRSEAGSFVMLAEKNGDKWVARKRYIIPARTYGSRTEITEGVKSGETIITVGYNDLNDGQEIRF
jgi:membrane fusion protein, multidrug efflux system